MAENNEIKETMEKVLGDDALRSKLLLDELSGSIEEAFSRYVGENLNDVEVIKSMCNDLHTKISSTGLKPSLAAYDTHIDLHIEHPDGPQIFAADLSIDLRGDNVNHPEAAGKAD